MGLLFSYGSNYPAQLAERLGHDVKTWGAYAEGFERVFRGYSNRWGGGVATLLPNPDTRVFGHVCRVTTNDLALLDAREGVPEKYLRMEIPVHIDAGTTEAQVYIARSNVFAAPSRAYLEACAKTQNAHWRDDGSSPITWRDIEVH